MIKDWVYEESGSPLEAVHKFEEKYLNYFPKSDINDLNEILQTLMEAWNYFPHKSLGGKSPYQVAKSNYLF